MEIEIGTVSETQPLTFVRWYEEAKEAANWNFSFRGLSFNDEKECLTLFSPDNVATTFYVEHAPNAKFTDTTPEGVRVLRALGRFAGMNTKTDDGRLVTTTENIEIVYRTELLVGGPLTLNMTRTDKGRLWTILDTQSSEEEE